MKKLMNKKGFTLMEMLIVIAIIVILVAIAFPTFSKSLDDAKTATDAANLRAAKAAAVVYGLDNTSLSGEFHFDLTTGKVTTGAGDSADYGESSANSESYIKITFTGTEPTVEWYDTTP